MIKAIFLDFYGTAVYENGPVSMGVVKQICQNSKAKSPEEAVGYWWKRFDEKLKRASGENYRLQYDLALESFAEALNHFESTVDPKELCDKMVQHWCCPPIYEDTKNFFDSVKLPVYIVTNSDDAFVESAAGHYGLKPQGIVTSEQARCYKPDKNIFVYALNKAGIQPEEAIHIGDSLRGDVACAASAGIRTLWLNREHLEVPEGVTAVGGLMEILDLI